MIGLLLAAPGAGSSGGGFDIFTLLLQATGAVRLVLFLLVLLSIIGWYVIAYKAFYLRRAQAESSDFLDLFWQAKRLDQVFQKADEFKRSPVAHMFKAGYVELSKLQSQKQKGEAGSIHEGGDLENVERALRRAMVNEGMHLESMTPFLATVGSAAPFIGLFGTVVGILMAFEGIAQTGSTNLSVVARPIADALVATAMGLVAAIPAVFYYNLLTQRVKLFASEMDDFAMEFLNIAERNFT